MKKTKIIIGIVVSALLVILGVYGFNRYNTDKTFNQKHESIVKAINEDHDFTKGYNELKDLSKNDKYKAKVNKSEVKAAKYIKDSDDDLNNKDVKLAKENISKAKDNDEDNTFKPAIEYIEKDIKKYEDTVAELDALDGKDDIEKVIEKYDFKHQSLVNQLKEKYSKSESKENIEVAKKEGQQKSQQSASSNSHVVSTVEQALVRNYEHYKAQIFAFIKKEGDELAKSNGGIRTDYIKAGTITDFGLEIDTYDNSRGIVGKHYFSMNTKTGLCYLGNPHIGTVQTYKIVYTVAV